MESSPLNLHVSPVLLDCHTNENDVDFIKLSSISPDGSTILTVSESSWVDTHEFNNTVLNKHRYYGRVDPSSSSGGIISNSRRLHVGETVYDCKWYPLMNLQDNNSNCFITTSRDHPISLWDGITGTIRGTYSGINHLDELDSAISLAFNMTGDKIYSGSNKMIRCFDISQPGKKSTSFPTTKSKKALLGQKGLISTLSFCPDYSGLYAAGSYAHSIGLYVENEKESVMQLDQLNFGVTCLKWSPDGKYLWAGGRNHVTLQCWDVRSTGSCVGEVKRSLQTQQRMTFDLDPWGQWLITGTQDGSILAYDTRTFELVSSFHHSSEVDVCSEVGGSCVNSTLFHPFSSILVSVQGERSFPNVTNVSESDDELSNEIPSKDSKSRMSSSVKFWSIDCKHMEMPTGAVNDPTDNRISE